MPVDKSDLTRWQSLDAAVVLIALADYAKEDVSYVPRLNTRSSRWHVIAGGHDHEIKAVFLGLALFDNASMWMAVFADMGASLLVVFNGLRLLRNAERG